jgi:hypothetical protein
MSDKVEKLYPANAAESADNVLELAVGEFKDVIVLGIGREDDFDIRATSGLSDHDVIAILEAAKTSLVLQLLGD